MPLVSAAVEAVCNRAAHGFRAAAQEAARLVPQAENPCKSLRPTPALLSLVPASAGTETDTLQEEPWRPQNAPQPNPSSPTTTS